MKQNITNDWGMVEKATRVADQGPQGVEYNYVIQIILYILSFNFSY